MDKYLYYKENDYELYKGAMQDVLSTFGKNSIDSIVCDPPYELNFMNKGWDNSGVAFQPDTWKHCYDVLKEAGADKADLVVATTTHDETNILSCLISEKMGAKASVARVRSYEYNNQLKIIRDDLGVDLPINPEKETANEITKMDLILFIRKFLL